MVFSHLNRLFILQKEREMKRILMILMLKQKLKKSNQRVQMLMILMQLILLLKGIRT